MEKIANHPESGKPDPKKASFKLLIYFNNGASRTFYNYHTSYNAELKKIIICEKTGLNKLDRLILTKYAGQYKTALIYHIESGKQIKKYCFNKLIQCADHFFIYKDGKIIFQLGNPNTKIN